MIQTVFKYRSK